jgi:phenylpropionate dioxygenase-like ring-hydroxylating dioxygenase large terminal subunit
VTQPSDALIRAAQAAGRRMADGKTPLILNEWYVAAFADELGRHLTGRKLLNRRVVMYRTENGEAVAMDDRCAHRSFPLSNGKLEGDSVVCAYHGFRYDSKGDCIEVPSQPKCPKGIGVRNFPLVERGPLVWIWMGDPALADESKIPALPWLTEPQWTFSKGYYAHPGNYVSLHENLLDLTHLSFLHAGTIGTPDYASAPYEVQLEEGRYLLTRRVAPTRLAPVWGKSTGIETDTAARIATSEFVSPSLHIVTVLFYDLALPEADRPMYRIRTAHIPVPESNTSTHYFIVHGRDFAAGNQWVTNFMHEGLFAAFKEDVVGLGKLEQMLADSDDESYYEMSVASDGPAVAMRRYLKKRADEEAAPQNSLQGDTRAVR